MAEPARRLVTVDEFLRFEGEPDRRYELVGGEIVMMAPPARSHGRMAARLAQVLGAGLRPPYAPEIEAGIPLPWSAHDFFVADLAVSCAPATGEERCCPEPVLVAEILSPATAAHDRSVKLPAYRRLPSVRHILLMAGDRCALEHYARSGPFWRLRDRGPGDMLGLEDLGVEIALDALYAGRLPEPPAPSA